MPLNDWNTADTALNTNQSIKSINQSINQSNQSINQYSRRTCRATEKCSRLWKKAPLQLDDSLKSRKKIVIHRRIALRSSNDAHDFRRHTAQWPYFYQLEYEMYNSQGKNNFQPLSSTMATLPQQVRLSSIREGMLIQKDENHDAILR